MARIFFCGDIINQYSDEQFIGESMRKIISKADYAVCNLEGALDSGKEQSRGMLQRPGTLLSLKEAGFKLCLLANNHITDYGINGLSYTIDQIRDLGMSSMGAGVSQDSVYKPLIVKVAGQRIGFVNVCEAQIGQFDGTECEYGYAWIGWPHLESIIRNLRKEVEFLFVCVHAGLEHYELPLKEYRDLYRRFCDWGADCIIGSHPHIAQGFEEYNQCFIFYSLGNFYFPRTGDADDTDYENNSYSIIFDTVSHTFELIYHHLTGHKVDQVNEVASKINLTRLNVSLSADYYHTSIRKQNDKAYDSLVARLYRNALNGQEPTDGLLLKLKNIVKYVFNLAEYNLSNERKHYREALLQRLIENETYRYLTIDVLKNRSNE